MFDELSTEHASYAAPKPVQSSIPDGVRQLEAAISEVMIIENSVLEAHDTILAQFIGRLSMDSEEAYEHLDSKLEPMNLLPAFSTDPTNNKHVISILDGREVPAPRSWYPNALLLVLTIFSTMIAGAVIEGVAYSFDELFVQGGILKGWIYASALMLILGSHELGHYFAAQHHKVSVTLPYFIPLPIGFFGTLGAFIQQRAPMRNRRQLFDVGIAGPLAGLFFAIPILIGGIATAEINKLPTQADCDRDETQCGYILEGNSLLYASLKYAVHGKWLPDDVEDMTLNQLAFAGWTGLFVTALNLIPVGQLDGGHILYTLLGKHARRVFMPALIAMAVLAFMNSSWFLWVLLLFFFGRSYNVPLNDITPLDPRRRIIGIITLAVFFLIFIPSPLTIVSFN
jgi:membrane-associated protease RseP (regulator of RpoE activity)